MSAMLNDIYSATCNDLVKHTAKEDDKEIVQLRRCNVLKLHYTIRNISRRS